MSKKTHENPSLKSLLPYLIGAILWGILMVIICVKNNELLIAIPLVVLGFIPIVWEWLISPNITEIDFEKISRRINPNAEQSILQTKGRIDRFTFWSRILAGLYLIILIRIFIIESHPVLDGILVNIWIIFNFIQAMKRMHDINKSGFFALIPFYNIILAFTKGTEGVNKFGESPKSNFQTSPK